MSFANIKPGLQTARNFWVWFGFGSDINTKCGSSSGSGFSCKFIIFGSAGFSSIRYENFGSNSGSGFSSNLIIFGSTGFSSIPSEKYGSSSGSGSGKKVGKTRTLVQGSVRLANL